MGDIKRYGLLVSVSGNTLTIDVTDTEALQVRKDGDGGDIFTIDTSNSLISLVGLVLGDGVLTMIETTTPTAVDSFGKIYCKADNKLYFQDGAGVEHEVAFV